MTNSLKLLTKSNLLKKYLAILIAVLALFAVIVQYQLMINNRVAGITETTIRFFSFFTILTNSLTAVYFVRLSYKILCSKQIINVNFTMLTAITVYITIVGLVYQILLRHIWSPVGLQKIVDELLHTINPTLVICFWFFSRTGMLLDYRKIPMWLLYPSIYLFYILTRGYFSNFYPYPFIDVSKIGFTQVMINSLGMMLLFIIVSIIFIWLNNNISSSTNKNISR
jgi:hypothetical protein